MNNDNNTKDLPDVVLPNGEVLTPLSDQVVDDWKSDYSLKSPTINSDETMSWSSTPSYYGSVEGNKIVGTPAPGTTYSMTDNNVSGTTPKSASSASSGASSDTKMTFSNVQSRSYGDELYMDEKKVDEAIELITKLGKDLYSVFSDALIANDSLRKKGEDHGWLSIASNFDHATFMNTQFFNLNGDGDSGKYVGNKLVNIYCGKDTSIGGFNSSPSFNGLAGALNEIKEAIINYSMGRDLNSARSSLFNWINLSGGDPSRFDPDYIAKMGDAGVVPPTVTAGDTLAPTITPSVPDIVTPKVPTIDVPDITLPDTSDILDSTDKPTRDPDIITKPDPSRPSIGSSIGSKKTGLDALTGGGISSLLGNEFEPDLDTVDSDSLNGESLSGNISDAISSFVAPDVNMASSKKIKTGSVGAAAAALAGLGTAGIVGGKVYLDKKKKDEEEEEDDSYDEFFDEKDDANEQESSVVDFKNEILQDV